MTNDNTVLLLSEEGMRTLDNQPFPDMPFAGGSVSAGDARGGDLAVIVDQHAVWTRTAGLWQQVVEAKVILNCVCWTREGGLLVGTESARLAWVVAGELDFIDAFDKVPERDLWMTPWGGPPDVRSLAVATDGTIYANIHVGWIVRSTDGGRTWASVRDGLEIDVHQVAAHPADASIVFAATADGFHISKNRGDRFERRTEGMPYLYARACACFADWNVYLMSTATGPHGNAQAKLFRSADAGQTWRAVMGLPEAVAKNIDTFQIAVVDAGHGLVVVNDTALYETNNHGLNWHKLRDDFPRLHGIVVVGEA